MERKKVLVAFGDILGFGPWIRRAITTPEESKDLIDEVYDQFEKIAIRMGCYVKFLGDGIMLVKEVQDKKEDMIKTTEKFLSDIHELSANVTGVILKHFPRPDGFRFRVAVGHVWKRETNKVLGARHMTCPKKMAGQCSSFMETKTPEYIGYVINLTQRLLKIAPQIQCICHESVKNIFTNDPEEFKFELVEKTEERPKGIDLEDLENLWKFSFIKGN